MKLYGRKNTLPHPLINSNQLRHYGVIVQDNPACDKPIYIMMEYNYSSIEMHMEGTITMARTLTPSEQNLNYTTTDCPQLPTLLRSHKDCYLTEARDRYY